MGKGGDDGGAIDCVAGGEGDDNGFKYRGLSVIVGSNLGLFLASFLHSLSQ